MKSGNTKETILQAAIKVIKRDKISGTRMKAISLETNMSNGLIHYHFATKDDLFLAVYDFLIAHFKENRKALLEKHQGDPEKAVLAFLDQKKTMIIEKDLECLQQDFRVYSSVNTRIREKVWSSFSQWQQSIRFVIDEGIRQGIFKETNADFVPDLMISSMIGASEQYFVNEKNFDIDNHFKKIGKIVLELLKSE